MKKANKKIKKKSLAKKITKDVDSVGTLARIEKLEQEALTGRRCENEEDRCR